jgi:hypothetical protein
MDLIKCLTQSRQLLIEMKTKDNCCDNDNNHSIGFNNNLINNSINNSFNNSFNIEIHKSIDKLNDKSNQIQVKTGLNTTLMTNQIKQINNLSNFNQINVKTIEESAKRLHKFVETFLINNHKNDIKVRVKNLKTRKQELIKRRAQMTQSCYKFNKIINNIKKSENDFKLLINEQKKVLAENYLLINCIQELKQIKKCSRIQRKALKV